jgi:saccharopine dehydrogenase-like NADP-dependent oxidoreductase
MVLGTGFVAEPTVEYLNRRTDYHITVVGYTLVEAQVLANKFESVQAMQADVSDKAVLLQLLKNYDVVVSLVPATFHLLIAQVCIQLKISMLTASYETLEMHALDTQAQAAGICIMNEIGLDPGIDHLAAMDIIDRVHKKGEQVESFVSWCGGIPAPDSNDNPMQYKFSWEPRGAIMVLLNDATYQKENKKVMVLGQNLMQWAQPIEIENLKLECYPNRESVHYKSIYAIDDVEDIIRGTLRYDGFCSIFQDVKNLGLMQTDAGAVTEKTTWKKYVMELNKVSNLAELRAKVSLKAWDALEWLGVFSQSSVAQKNCSLDVLCDLLLKKLAYKDDERDMVVLQHKFVIKKADGSRYFLQSTLKQLGEIKGYSAMAKTVGYPIAMATQLIADKVIKDKGILIPVTKDIYQPILKSLQQEGIDFHEIRKEESEISKEEFLVELY